MTAAEKWEQLDQTDPERSIGSKLVLPGDTIRRAILPEKLAKVRMAVIPEKLAARGKPYSVQMYWPGLRPVGGEFETQPKLGE